MIGIIGKSDVVYRSEHRHKMSVSDKIYKDGASKSTNDGVCEVTDMMQNMSTVDEGIVTICANCGKKEEEGCHLKSCAACTMVKYCSRECQFAHRPMHKKECKKRAAKLQDEKLFKQPPQKEDCPICLLCMTSLNTGSRYKSCCGKVVCSGCIYAIRMRTGEQICPFCRSPAPEILSEAIELDKRRMDKGDPVAMYNIGAFYRDGSNGFPQDWDKALELWLRAAELGYTLAYNNIGYSYNNGIGVEQDKKKAIRYYELSAMGGNATARMNLGLEEQNKGNVNRALTHYLIAIVDGDIESLKSIQRLYSFGHASKEDYTEALRTYQAYLGEIKSLQRDEAAAACDEFKYY